MPEPIKATPLSAALGVNGLVICDCGYDSFRVGLAYNPENGNNFIRILEGNYTLDSLAESCIIRRLAGD